MNEVAAVWYPAHAQLLTVTIAAQTFALRHLFSFARDSDELVAVVRGNLELETLSLDIGEGEFGPGAPPFVSTLIVDGSFTLNHDTDGAHGLVVLGELRAHDVCVGGQEFYIRGSLEAKGVCCVSYNHGELAVDGDLRAQLLVSDDSRIWLTGSLHAPVASTGDERIGLLEGRSRTEQTNVRAWLCA